jgi:hypothetical protein
MEYHLPWYVSKLLHFFHGRFGVLFITPMDKLAIGSLAPFPVYRQTTLSCVSSDQAGVTIRPLLGYHGLMLC